MSPRLKIWLLSLAIAAFAPTLAEAHAILEESQPPSGGTVKAGAVDLHLRFNSRIDRGRSRLTLIRPDHVRDQITIVQDGAPDIIDAHLKLTPGAYVVRWQVLAVDGHITRGDIPIVATAP